MQCTSALVRTLVAALAIAALAAPSSLARPIDSYPPESKERATTEVPPRPLDRLTPDSPEPAPESVAPPSHDYEAGRPHDRAATTGDDTPWAVVGLAITAGVLLLGGVALASRNVVRTRRARVAA
jgi:hypothetical protein